MGQYIVFVGPSYDGSMDPGIHDSMDSGIFGFRGAMDPWVHGSINFKCMDQRTEAWNALQARQGTKLRIWNCMLDVRTQIYPKKGPGPRNLKEKQK